MVRLKVPRHEKPEISDDKRENLAASNPLLPVLWHLVEMHVIVYSKLFAIFFVLCVALSFWDVVDEEISLLKRPRLEPALLEKFPICGKEVQAS